MAVSHLQFEIEKFELIKPTPVNGSPCSLTVRSNFPILETIGLTVNHGLDRNDYKSLIWDSLPQLRAWILELAVSVSFVRFWS